MILKICFSSYMHILQNIDDCDDCDNCADDDDCDYWDDVDDVDDGDDSLEEVALALRGAADNGYDDLPSPTFRLCTKHTLQGVQTMGKRGEGTFLTFFVYKKDS